MKNKAGITVGSLLASGLFLVPFASAQITNVVFSEDFSSPTLDPNKLVFQDHSLEGGKGTIEPVLHDGVVEFTGVVTEQWWAGATLRVVPTFSASAETNVMVSVDRVSENGIYISGSSTRSCLWVMDSSRTYYVLFADNQNESHWGYNRKIGQSGDVATGPGTGMARFNAAGSPYRDEGLHRMTALANGKTVKLYLDGLFGAEVKFPFSPLIFEIGSAARANTDMADTTFDNLLIQTIGAEAFSATSLTLLTGQTSSNVTVRIPPGVNKTQAVQVRVITSDPAIAIPVGAVGDTLTLTFTAGGANEQIIGLKSIGPPGQVTCTLTNDIGMASANSLSVLVIEGPGVRLTDNFSGPSIDANVWTNSDQGFETGIGTFSAGITNSQLVMGGLLDQSSFWGGMSLNTIKAFTASPDLPLSFEIDRVGINPTSGDGVTPSTGARTGVFITTSDRSQFVFFGQDVGETGWEVNVNPGNPTGSGTALAVFSALTDTNSHRMKLLADGSQVQVFLDGQPGGSFNFAVNSGIFFDVGVYARDYYDAVVGTFDNVTIANVFPAVTVAPSAITTLVGANTNSVAITLPRLLTASSAVNVTVTSSAPGVAAPVGASNGALTLTFPAGSTNVQTFKVLGVSPGVATLTVTNDQSVPVANSVNVIVTPPPVVWFSDTFSQTAIDSNKWAFDSTPLIAGGTLTDDSAVAITNNTLGMFVHCLDADWPGFGMYAKTNLTASLLSPVDFEIDRVGFDYVLVGGNTSKQRTGVWIKDSTTNYVFFSELGSYDSYADGWQYNRVIGQPGDNPITAANEGGGVYMSALASPSNIDHGNHHLKAVANGSTVTLFLDGVLGAQVPFPFSEGLVFGFGAYANFSNGAGNIVIAFFDNAAIHGYPLSAPLGGLTATKQGNDIVITWSGQGRLQSSSAVGSTANWSDVTPAPTGNTYTIAPAAQLASQFFRLAQ